MKYMNTKTRTVIETACVIKGGNWKPVEEVQPTKSTQNPVEKKTTQKKPAAKKKSGE